MDVHRTSRKKVKWAFRTKLGDEDWGEWLPASSASHVVEQLKDAHPENDEIQTLTEHRLYNQFGRGARNGARRPTKATLPPSVEIRRV